VMKDIPISGWSTMPYKQGFLETSIHRPTRKPAACNTVVRGQDGKSMGSTQTSREWYVPLHKLPLSGQVLILGGRKPPALFRTQSAGARIWILIGHRQAQKLAK